jgi:hypothetical protein
MVFMTSSPLTWKVWMGRVYLKMVLFPNDIPLKAYWLFF